MVFCTAKAGKKVLLLPLMTSVVLTGLDKAGRVSLPTPAPAQRQRHQTPDLPQRGSQRKPPTQTSIYTSVATSVIVLDVRLILCVISFGPGSRDAALSSSKILKLHWKRTIDLTYVLIIVLMIESELAEVYQLAGICRLTDVRHRVQILLRMSMWSHKTVINLPHRTLRAFQFNRWLPGLSVTTVTYHCLLTVKTWCWWATRHEKLDRDKASQLEQACKLLQCEVQPPMMTTMIDGSQLIGGTPNAEEPIDIEIERIADPGNRNMTLQPRTILNAHAAPDDIYYEPQQGVQCQMHAFNALAGRPLLQVCPKSSAYNEVALDNNIQAWLQALARKRIHHCRNQCISAYL